MDGRISRIVCEPQLSARDGLPGEHVGASHAVLPGCALFLGATKAVEVGRYANVFKTQVAQERHQLCLRQSAGDSSGPQVDVAANVLAEFGVKHYIGKLQPAAGTQQAAYLSERFLFFGDEVEHAVGDNHIHAGIG